MTLKSSSHRPNASTWFKSECKKKSKSPNFLDFSTLTLHMHRSGLRPVCRTLQAGVTFEHCTILGGRASKRTTSEMCVRVQRNAQGGPHPADTGKKATYCLLCVSCWRRSSQSSSAPSWRGKARGRSTGTDTDSAWNREPTLLDYSPPFPFLGLFLLNM